LGRCQTYTEFLALLDNQNRNDPHMTPELYQHINRRMTETFNRFLDKQLYMGLEIDDFVDDWPQFPSFCTKKFGELMTEKVEGSAKEVIARAVSVLHGDGLTKHLHTLSEAERAALDKPAVFCDRYSVTQMPWTMYEMDSHWRLEGVCSSLLFLLLTVLLPLPRPHPARRAWEVEVHSYSECYSPQGCWVPG
jgi:hypothetical protein